MVIRLPILGLRLVTFDDAEAQPAGWIPFETFLPADVYGFARGSIVTWMDHMVVTFPSDRVLYPHDEVTIGSETYVWAGETCRCIGREPFNAAVIELPDGMRCVTTLTSLFGAIAEFLPRQPEA